MSRRRVRKSNREDDEDDEDKNDGDSSLLSQQDIQSSLQEIALTSSPNTVSSTQSPVSFLPQTSHTSLENSNNPPKKQKTKSLLKDDKRTGLSDITNEQTKNYKAGPGRYTLSEYSLTHGKEGEPIYCFCQSYKEDRMICCDNESCQFEWFHFKCVGLRKDPGSKAKWYCSENCCSL